MSFRFIGENDHVCLTWRNATGDLRNSRLYECIKKRVMPSEPPWQLLGRTHNPESESKRHASYVPYWV